MYNLYNSKWGQPTPVPNDKTPVFVSVMDDIESRAEVGKIKYGTYLQTDNGRDALKDAYEEALDLCMYLKQALMERDGQ